MRLALSRLHFPITTLGPGRRIGLWLQGCSIQCPGCISLDTWEKNVGLVDMKDLLDRLVPYVKEADGITISGGEPFDQTVALFTILRFWRSVSDRSAVVFTGYEVDDVAGVLRENDGLIDALVSGPFRSDLPQTLAMRGSDNQQIHALTDLGKVMHQYDRTVDSGDRRLDAFFEREGEVWLAGIPARGDLSRLRKALQGAGHSAATSSQKDGGRS